MCMCNCNLWCALRTKQGINNTTHLFSHVVSCAVKLEQNFAAMHPHRANASRTPTQEVKELASRLRFTFMLYAGGEQEWCYSHHYINTTITTAPAAAAAAATLSYHLAHRQPEALLPSKKSSGRNALKV